MREQSTEQGRKKTRNPSRPGFVLGRIGWDCLSAGYGKREFSTARRFYYYDWRTRTYQPDLPTSWLAYHYTIISASTATFTLGIGQLILKIWGIHA